MLIALRLGWEPEKLVYQSQKSTKGLKPGDPRYNVNSGKYHELSTEATALARYLLRDDERVYAAAVRRNIYHRKADTHFIFIYFLFVVVVVLSPFRRLVQFTVAPSVSLLSILSHLVLLMVLIITQHFQVEVHGRQTSVFPAFKDRLRRFRVAQEALIRSTGTGSNHSLPYPGEDALKIGDHMRRES